MKKFTIALLLPILLINHAWAVDFSELKFQGKRRDRIAVLKKDGQAYTGIATSFFDNGQKEYESYYWQGRKHGPSYTWVKTGELKKEKHWLQNKKLGAEISWEKLRSNDTQDKKQPFVLSEKNQYINDEQMGIQTRWYRGVKSRTQNYFNGKRHGMQFFWDNKGNLESQSHYLNGKKNGLEQEFYADGSLEKENTRSKNNDDGLKMSWSRSGLIKSVDFYTDGRSEGVSSRYSDTGILKSERSYRNDKEFGINYQYYADGNPYLLLTSHTGKRIKYYKNSNQRAYEEYFVGGYRDNNQYRWHSNGQLERISAYELNQIKGLITNWYANGIKASEAIYDGYNINGNQKVWYDNGQLKEDINYVNGERDGASFVWYRNGQLKSKTDYKLIKGTWNSYGKKQGDALEWYADGKKKVEAHFSNDELIGIRRTWRDDGSLYSEKNMSEQNTVRAEK